MRSSHPSLMIGALAASVTLATGGCGTTAPSATAARGQPQASVLARPAQGSRALCRDANAVRSITVDRVVGIPQNHFHFALPARVTITSRGGIPAVAGALCALPPLTLTNCPNDFSVSYRLLFSPARLGIDPVQVDATGCGSVTGLGLPRRMVTQQFWRVLGSAMGLAGGTASAVRTLQGSLPWIAG
jgi:hypothetical protein